MHVTTGIFFKYLSSKPLGSNDNVKIKKKHFNTNGTRSPADGQVVPEEVQVDCWRSVIALVFSTAVKQLHHHG